MEFSTNKGIFRLREANTLDIEAIVRIHVTSWNLIYPDYHPKPTPALREQQWKLAFQNRADDWTCFVAEHEEQELAGFASCHRFYDAALPYRGQLDKIHLQKKFQRIGLGKKLVGCVVDYFLSRGIDSMILFADPANPAIRFYDNLQGGRLLDKEGNFQGAFGWKSISNIPFDMNTGKY